MTLLESVNNEVMKLESNEKGLVSDGFHTFDELYDTRLALTVALFNEWTKQKKNNVHKSMNHNDGQPCFGPNSGWFIVSAQTPLGLISFHYETKDWHLFKCEEVENALFEYDGHTTADVIRNLKELY